METNNCSSIKKIKIIQNEFFGSILIYESAKAFYKASQKTQGMPVGSALLVLPIIFDEKIMLKLSTKISSTALIRTFIENPTFKVGMQIKIQKYALLSFKSLHIALSSGLLNYDPQNFQLIPAKVKKYQRISKSPQIEKACKRLGEGSFFLGLEQIANLLEVKF